MYNIPIFINLFEITRVLSHIIEFLIGFNCIASGHES